MGSPEMGVAGRGVESLREASPGASQVGVVTLMCGKGKAFDCVDHTLCMWNPRSAPREHNPSYGAV